MGWQYTAEKKQGAGAILPQYRAGCPLVQEFYILGSKDFVQIDEGGKKFFVIALKLPPNLNKK